MLLTLLQLIAVSLSAAVLVLPVRAGARIIALLAGLVAPTGLAGLALAGLLAVADRAAGPLRGRLLEWQARTRAAGSSEVGRQILPLPMLFLFVRFRYAPGSRRVWRFCRSPTGSRPSTQAAGSAGRWLRSKSR